MENTTLTLKNIYRLLTRRDWPVFSDHVLKESARKGLTILSFYSQTVHSSWREGRYGRLIFPADGSRSRYASELMNRRDAFPYYKTYQKELLQNLTPQRFLLQIQSFQHFLSEKEYNQPAFESKIHTFLQLIGEQDPLLSVQALEYLTSNANAQGIPLLFLHSWLLSALWLHAVSGPQMDSDLMVLFRQQRSYQPDAQYRLFQRRETRENGLLTPEEPGSRDILPSGLFFGREQALFDLFEALQNQKKLLLFGAGGIGKSELLHQLRRLLLTAEPTPVIYEISYDSSLAESISRSLPDLPGITADEKFHTLLYHLRKDSAEKTVFLLDQAIYRAEELPLWKELLAAKAALLVSTRSCTDWSELPFTMYSLPPLTGEAACLVFRSHYKKPLSKEEKARLRAFLEEEAIGQPLILSVLGRAARYNEWSLDTLLSHLNKGPQHIRWQEGGIDEDLAKILRRLYPAGRLSPLKKSLVRHLALLPSGVYTAEDLAPLYPKRNILPALLELSQQGWLTGTENSFGLHPLIGESVLQSGLSEGDFTRLWKWLGRSLTSGNTQTSAALPPQRAAQWLLHAVPCTKGPVSSDLFDMILQAGEVLHQAEGGPVLYEKLKRLSLRCETIFLQQQARLQVLLCRGEAFDPETVKGFLDKSLNDLPALEEACFVILPKLAELDAYQDFCAEIADRLQRLDDRPATRLLVHEIRLSRALNQADMDQTLIQLQHMRDCYEQAADPSFAPLLQEVWINTVFLLYALRKHVEEADQLYEAYEAQRFVEATPSQQILKLRMQAAYADAHRAAHGAAYRADHRADHKAAFGAPREAADSSASLSVQYTRQMLELLEKTSGTDTRTYRITEYDLAMFLKKDGQTAEALRQFDALIEKGDDPKMNPDFYPLILLNAGVTYFQDGNPAKGEELIATAHDLAAQRQEPFSKAESAYWLARVEWEKAGHTNETSQGAAVWPTEAPKEQAFLEEAASFMLTNYGPEHEKCRYIAARLKELSQPTAPKE